MAVGGCDEGDLPNEHFGIHSPICGFRFRSHGEGKEIMQLRERNIAGLLVSLCLWGGIWVW